MRFVILVSCLWVQAFAAPLTWNFCLTDLDKNEINQKSFEDTPVTLVYVVEEGVIFHKGGFEAVSKTGKAFSRSLPSVPAIIAVPSNYDSDLFKSAVEDNTKSLFLSLSLYLRLHLKDIEQASVDFIKSRVRFVQDGEEKIANRFGIGRNMGELPYRLLVIDETGTAVSLP